MSDNFLKRKEDKTELIVKGNPKTVVKVQHFELAIGDSIATLSASARNLGVIFDDRLSFKQFCLKSASAAAFYIRSLSEIREYLSCEFTNRLSMSLVF